MEDMGDLGDLFGGLFGGGAGRTRTTQRGPQRGADMEAQLHLSFQDAVHGVTTSVNVPQEVRCSNCRGSGAAPGTSTHTCPRCGGTGSLNDNQGLFSLSTVCPDCMGRGTLFDTPCPVCHGTGTEHKVRAPCPARLLGLGRVFIDPASSLRAGRHGANGPCAGTSAVVASVLDASRDLSTDVVSDRREARWLPRLVLKRAPQVAAGQGAVWSPRLGDLLHRDRVGQ